MQTTSYRVLKWTLLAGVAASMATACVVTSGDGDDDIFDGGESGSSTTAGKTTGGSSAGSNDGGKTSTGGGGSSTAGTTTTGGDGGTGSSYVPGLCQADDPTPTSEPSCSPKATDEGLTCKICLKSMCCTDWQTCYGDTPTTACGWGQTEDAPGQFDCIQKCFVDGAADATDADVLLGDCAAMCANQCDNPDNGLIMDSTSSLVDCANTNCQDDCFPF